jgi:hypothetical protein
MTTKSDEKPPTSYGNPEIAVGYYNIGGKGRERRGLITRGRRRKL